MLSVLQTFLHYFNAKVAGVHVSTADDLSLSFSSPSSCSLFKFRLLSVVDVDIVAGVRKLPDKQCDSDAMLTCLLKDYADVLASFLADRCVQTAVFKAAYVTSLLKKPDGCGQCTFPSASIQSVGAKATPCSSACGRPPA